VQVISCTGLQIIQPEMQGAQPPEVKVYPNKQKLQVVLLLEETTLAQF